MAFADLFVGSLSILLGAAALWAAVAGSESVHRSHIVRFIERRGGGQGVRIFFGLLGALLITAGFAVIAGFSPGWLDMPFLQTP